MGQAKLRGTFEERKLRLLQLAGFRQLEGNCKAKLELIEGRQLTGD